MVAMTSLKKVAANRVNGPARQAALEPQCAPARARWQRCMIYFYRNVFSHVPAAKVRDVAHMLRAIHAQESREAAEQKARMIIEELKARKMSKAAELVEQAVNETLTTGRRSEPTTRWSGS